MGKHRRRPYEQGVLEEAVVPLQSGEVGDREEPFGKARCGKLEIESFGKKSKVAVDAYDHKWTPSANKVKWPFTYYDHKWTICVFR
jgi:hypothetical protein